MALQCILAHCGVPENKYVAKLAKEDAQTAQPGANVSYQEQATITKAFMTPSQEKDAIMIMVRLRTAHTRLNAHMHTTIEMVP